MMEERQGIDFQDRSTDHDTFWRNQTACPPERESAGWMSCREAPQVTCGWRTPALFLAELEHAYLVNGLPCPDTLHKPHVAGALPSCQH